jgi:carbamoyl-phosphate synthase large subunit
MKKLLFTGGGGAGNEALFRLLGSRYEMHFADADVQAIDPAIPQARRHQIPFAGVPDFGKKLCELFRTLEIDLLVPGVDEELSAVAALVEEGRLSALLPPKRFVDTHLDKLVSMRSLGAAAPQTVLAEDAAAIGFPCIVKPRSGRGSRGVAVIHSPEQLAAYLTFYQAPPETIIAQELGVGQEFTVMMAADSSGGLRAVVPVKVGIKRGITLRAETCREAAVEAACRAIHEADPVAGCYNIQLIRRDDGRILVFEINPRVSTTFCLGVAAGVNPIELFLSEPDGAEALLPFAEGLCLRRFWNNRLA